MFSISKSLIIRQLINGLEINTANPKISVVQSNECVLQIFIAKKL